MRNLRLTIQNIIIQFSFFIGFCGVLLFATLYLRDKGFSIEFVGLLLGGGNLFSAVLQQFSARVADRSHRLSLRDVAAIQLALPILIMLPILVFESVPQFYYALVFFLLISFELGSQSILNSISLAYESQGYKISFSVIRGFGSLGFSVASLALGAFFKSNPSDYLILFITLSHLVTSITIILLPQTPKVVRVVKKEEKDDSTLDFYRKYPIFIPLVIGGTLLFIGHTLFSNFLVYIMENVGGTEDQMGIAGALAGFLEIIPFFSYNFLRKKLPDRVWLMISTIFFTVKGILLVIAVNPDMIYFAQSAQMLAYGLFTPAFTYFAHQIVERKDMVQGQAVTMVVGMFGGALGSFLAGVVMGQFGVSASLLMATIVSGIGTVICIAGLTKGSKKLRTQAS